jgi:hypothetical protein
MVGAVEYCVGLKSKLRGQVGLKCDGRTARYEASVVASFANAITPQQICHSLLWVSGEQLHAGCRSATLCSGYLVSNSMQDAVPLEIEAADIAAVLGEQHQCISRKEVEGVLCRLKALGRGSGTPEARNCSSCAPSVEQSRCVLRT